MSFLNNVSRHKWSQPLRVTALKQREVVSDRILDVRVETSTDRNHQSTDSPELCLLQEQRRRKIEAGLVFSKTSQAIICL
jgi:hypothetical protein